MKVALLRFENQQLHPGQHNDNIDPAKVGLVLAFGTKTVLSENDLNAILKNEFPQADVVQASTSGQIYDDAVSENIVSVTAIQLEKTTHRAVNIRIQDFENSFDAGRSLANSLAQEGLTYVLVISDGALVNGSELVRGIHEIIDHRIPVTGGLAGDDANFVSTLTGLNQVPAPGVIVAVGFYGDQLVVGHGTMGGWDLFGPEREITKSSSNVLYEIDGKNALELYKMYLGNYADELPGSALLFPLAVKIRDTDEPLVRTILSIDQNKQSMVFAGDVPVGSKVRFMRANFDRVIDAASHAGYSALKMQEGNPPKLALLISCVGRKIILDSRTEEEILAVREAVGDATFITGFYSYGEISPLTPHARCELHNQTMTITTFDEL